MVLISFTNIVVDEFSYGKRHPMKRYIYFLTHMHSGNLSFISNELIYNSYIYTIKIITKASQLAGTMDQSIVLK